MEKFVAWVIDNKQWLFSGIGVTVVALILSFILKKRSASSNQNIRSGDSSINTQAGRDVNVEMKKKGNYVGKD